MPANSYIQFAFMLMPLLATLFISNYVHRLVGYKLQLSVHRHIERIIGIACMLFGLFVFVANDWVKVDAFKNSLHWNESAWFWSALLISASAVAGYSAFLKAKEGSYLWQLRQLPKDLALSALLVWVMYLLLYEFYFRWLLLPYGKIPLYVLLLLNLSAYGVLHLPHGRKEALGSIPYGILLALATIDCASIWPAFLGHMSLVVFTQFVPSRRWQSNADILMNSSLTPIKK